QAHADDFQRDRVESLGELQLGGGHGSSPSRAQGSAVGQAQQEVAVVGQLDGGAAGDVDGGVRFFQQAGTVSAAERPEPAVHIDLHALTGVRFQHDAGAVLVPFVGDVGAASHGLHVAAADGPDAGVDQQDLGLGPRGAGAELLFVVGDEALPE